MTVDGQGDQGEGARAVDDDLARALSEFDSLADLRADIERRIREELDEEIEDASVPLRSTSWSGATDVRTTGFVVESRTRELINRFIRSLQARGIDAATYLQVTGQTPSSLEQQLRAEASSSVARELVLEAVAEKLGIEVDRRRHPRGARAAGEPEEAIDDLRARRRRPCPQHDSYEKSG